MYWLCGLASYVASQSLGFFICKMGTTYLPHGFVVRIKGADHSAWHSINGSYCFFFQKERRIGWWGINSLRLLSRILEGGRRLEFESWLPQDPSTPQSLYLYKR